MRLAILVALEAVGLLVLFVFVAVVVIPLAAPPPAPITPTLPSDALHDCPRGLPGCR
jgi:hypothetical protein